MIAACPAAAFRLRRSATGRNYTLLQASGQGILTIHIISDIYFSMQFVGAFRI